MRSMILTALSGAAFLGFAAPAVAHPDDGDDQHAEQHDQLGQQHGDVHQQLDAIHNDAHEQGLSWYEHQQLHRQLEQAHARADYNIEMQHYYQHQNDRLGYGGYGGYSGYNNGYSYAPQSYYRSNGYTRYNRGYGYRRYARVRHHRYKPYRGY